MSGGITFSGRVVYGDESSDDGAESIEIHFDDKKFLQKAANKKPQSTLEYLRSTVAAFSEGTYSWPFDYTLCLHWIAGTAGFYGGDIKSVCDHQTRRIVGVFQAALTVTYYLVFRGLLFKLLTNEHARLLVKKTVEHSDLSERLYDRLPNLLHGASKSVGRYMSGMAFTDWMQSGGKLKGQAPKGVSFAIAMFNLLAVNWGAALHVVLKHGDAIDIVQIFAAMITGDPDYRLTDEDFSELFNTARELADNIMKDSENEEDYKVYRDFMDSIIKFGESGGKG